MKRLMFLISTEGKTTEKISEEAWAAYLKYQEVERKIKANQNNISELKTSDSNKINDNRKG